VRAHPQPLCFAYGGVHSTSAALSGESAAAQGEQPVRGRTHASERGKGTLKGDTCAAHQSRGAVRGVESRSMQGGV